MPVVVSLLQANSLYLYIYKRACIEAPRKRVSARLTCVRPRLPKGKEDIMPRFRVELNPNGDRAETRRKQESK